MSRTKRYQGMFSPGEPFYPLLTAQTRPRPIPLHTSALLPLDLNLAQYYAIKGPFTEQLTGVVVHHANSYNPVTSFQSQ